MSVLRQAQDERRVEGLEGRGVMVRPAAAALLLLLLLLLASRPVDTPDPEDWSRFRGPNGSGVSISTRVPAEFGPDRNVIWKTELPFGHSSPALTRDRIFLTAARGERLVTICLDRRTGRIFWERQAPRARLEKLDSRNGPAGPTPTTDGRNVYVFFADFGLLSYDMEGRERWRLPLGPFNNLYGMGSSPVLVDDIVIPACGAIARQYADATGRVTLASLPNGNARSWIDLDSNGEVSESEWDYYRAAMASENGMLAIRLGGRGDMTDASVRWKYHKAVPQLPSPLVYENVLYMVNDGGIVTALNPDTGGEIGQGRLKGAIDSYYASPVAGDGKIFLLSERGKVAVLGTGGSLEPIVVNDLGDDVYATPAISDGKIYIRTRGWLYCFGMAHM